MRYEVVEIGGDPEFDESGFILFRPLGQRQHQFEEIMWDYHPAEGDGLLEETLLRVLPGVGGTARKLGLRSPFVALARLSDRNHAARFVDGTESEGPVFLLDPEPARDLTGYRLVEFVQESLLHELGHAYLRTRGVPYYEKEENVVEQFARTGRRGILDKYEDTL